MRVRRRVDRDDPAAALDELLERGAAVADQPFGCGVLRVGRAAEQDDDAKLAQPVG